MRSGCLQGHGVKRTVLPWSGAGAVDGRARNATSQTSLYSRTRLFALLQDELDACMDGGTKDSATYPTSDLTRPEYSTPWFRMYCFKAGVWT